MSFEDLSDFVPDGTFTAGFANFPDHLQFSPDRGDGCYLYTESGEEYLDYLLGSGPMIVGHAHPKVVDAVAQQMERGSHLYFPTEEAHRLAKRIIDAVPCADKMKFTSTGTEATYLAIRLARAHTGKEKIVKFSGAYHGWHDESLVSSSHANSEELLRTQCPDGTIDSAGMAEDILEEVIVAPYNELQRTREIVAEDADDIAAVLVEPVMRSLAPKDGFLRGLRDVCDEHGIVLIFDEVVTGFRLAWGGAQESFDVEPDLATYGKAIGGGTPLAAVCGHSEILELTSRDNDDRVVHAGTLNGNPLCVAAGHATLDVLETPGMYPQLNQYAAAFRTLIDDLIAASSLSGRAIGEGPIIDYVLTPERNPLTWESILRSDTETKMRLDEQLVEQGLVHIIGGKRYISTEHGDEELERTHEAYKEVFEEFEM